MVSPAPVPGNDAIRFPIHIMIVCHGFGRDNGGPVMIRDSAALLKPDARNRLNVPHFFRFLRYFQVSDVKYLKDPLDYKPYTAICNGTS